MSPSRKRRVGGAAAASLALAGALVAGTPGIDPASAQEFTGDVLYEPDLTTFARDSASYPAMVRLEHSGAQNGTLLATHDFNSTDVLDRPGAAGQPNTGIPVYRSTDDGDTWTEISRIDDTSGAAQFYFPSLFEFPQALGTYPAGTLVAGVTAMGPVGTSSPTVNNLDVYVSTDHGVNWAYMSSCDTQPTYTVTHGIWENVFAVSSSGQLVCYYSDERDSDGTYPQYSQLLVHRVSSDGGLTWGPRVIDVAPQTNERPGMATVVKDSAGTYFMSFEVCGDDAMRCATYLKTSTSGTNWGTPTDWGTRIVTSDNRWLEGNPYLAWSPVGGPQGTLVAHGRTIRNPQSGTELPPESAESQATLFVNTNGGAGAWSEIPAPFDYAPLGGGTCPGYRASFLPSVSGHELLYMAPVRVALDTEGPHCEMRYGKTTIGTLPYYAPLDGDTDEGFTTYDGTWTVDGGVYRNTSGGLGDKAVTGSTGWSDYTAQVDLRFDSLWSGASAGLMFRTKNPDSGVDSFRGYYLGLDRNGGITLARMDAGTYTPLQSTLNIGAVSTGTWYHLTAQAIGCTFRYTAQQAGSTAVQAATYTDSGCAYTTGQIGLRTYGAQASWRSLAASNGGTTAYDPVYAPFESGSATGWTTYGGSWSVSAPAYNNTSGGLGDKSLTGGANWGPNTVTADVGPLTSSGDAGLVARVTNPGVGADAYAGYYAGVFPATDTVALGRADNGTFSFLQSAVVPGGVAPGSWYRLTLEHVGCTFTVTAQPTTSHDKASFTVTNSGCLTNGQVGVRVYGTTAAWRYFSMLPR